METSWQAKWRQVSQVFLRATGCSSSSKTSDQKSLNTYVEKEKKASAKIVTRDPFLLTEATKRIFQLYLFDFSRAEEVNFQEMLRRRIRCDESRKKKKKLLKAV